MCVCVCVCLLSLKKLKLKAVVWETKDREVAEKGSFFEVGQPHDIGSGALEVSPTPWFSCVISLERLPYILSEFCVEGENVFS